MPSATGLTDRAIQGSFYQKLTESLTGSWWNKMFMWTSISDQDAEEYRFLGMLPAPREWRGELQKKSIATYRIPIANKTWENSIRWPSEDYKRDKTGQISSRAAELALTFPRHISSLLTTLIVNGTGSTYGTAYDGQFFLDTDHASGASGTQKNVLTASEVTDLNVGTAAAPTALEMANAILNSIAYAQAIKDDQGEPINEDANEWAIMYSANLGGAVQAAVYNATLSGGVSNPLYGADGPSNGALKIRPINNGARLTTTTVFYLFRLDGTTKPFIFQEVEKPSVAILGIGSEHEIANNEVLWRAKAIYNIGYGQWEHAYKCTLS